MRKLPLHWKILIAMVIGLIVGLIFNSLEWQNVTIQWIKPFGTIFINLLKLLAVPLIFASLIKGVTSASDIASLSRIGIKTIAIYLMTTVIAIIFALVLVAIFQPGNSLDPDIQKELFEQYGPKAGEQSLNVAKLEKGPLKFLEEMVPDNIVAAMQDNSKMLKVIFFTIVFGIAIILLPKEKTKVIRQFFDELNEIVLKIIDLVMLYAPVGVFALLATLVAENGKNFVELLSALGYYALVVILALASMVFIIYPILVRFFSKISVGNFFRGIAPAQLLAFSTSSSAATLPLTMECSEEKLGISNKIASFVLPLGATVNMDGTSIWQTVTTVFLAQLYGYDLSIGQQLTIILTATLASIGSVGVPGGGIVMLIIVLESVGLPPDGIAIILGVDRILDMCRTVVNVTGDTAVAAVVASSENEVTEMVN